MAIMNTDDVIRSLQITARNADNLRDKRIVEEAIAKVKQVELANMPMLTEEEFQMESKPQRVIEYRKRVGCSLTAARDVIESYEVGR